MVIDAGKLAQKVKKKSIRPFNNEIHVCENELAMRKVSAVKEDVC